MDFFQNRFGGRRIDVFQTQYRVYTGAYIDKNIDEGGKIILPQSALDALSRMHVVYPMLFKIENSTTHTYTHCGVLEFSGEEGCVYIPFWMLDYLGVSPGQLVTVTSATLPKGTYVKIRPQSKAFLEISDPRAVLEKKLRNFSCLTKNDTIIIDHNDKQYYIDIMEVAARSVNGPVEAVSIVETDVEVDFDRPVDMPLSPVLPPPSQMFPPPLIGTSSNTATAANSGNSKQATNKQPEQPEPPKFVAFTGSGRRLDGKAVVASPPPPPPAAADSTAKQQQQQKPPQQPSNNGNASSSGSKVVFGTQQQSSKPNTPAAASSSSSSAAPSSSSSSSTAPRSDPSKPSPPPAKVESKPEFVPFSGKGRSLRG